MFSTNDPHGAGDLPDILTHLEARYRAEKGLGEAELVDFRPFMDWAKAYLDQHRPSEVFAVDTNYGVILSNSQQLQISPSAPISGATGDMANPDNSISVTRSKR